MDMPFFSVVIPLYNKEKYIRRTLESVIRQTFSDFEVIIVDDGSTDNSVKVVESFDDPRIRLNRQANGGVSSARNLGIDVAKGRYIAFLDADDEWREDKLEKHFEFFGENPDCKWATSAFTRRGPRGDKEDRFGETQVISDALEAFALKNWLVVFTCAVVIRKDCFGAGCFFSEDMSAGEDREVWLKLACRFPEIGYIGETLSIYNLGQPGSLTSSVIQSQVYPFLELGKRIEEFSETIGKNRKSNLEKYLKQSNRNNCFNLWIGKPGFINSIDVKILEESLRPYELTVLNAFNDFPQIFKRLIRKIFDLTNR
jgi:glycosyltransferase involved in cell wall biosynthesis